MRAAAVVLIFIGMVVLSGAQAPSSVETVDDLMNAFDAIRAIDSVDERQAAAAELYDMLYAGGRVPFIDGGDIVFLYRGDARSVHWVGDWSGFSIAGGTRGDRIPDTDLWVAVTEFPLDARLDYIVMLNYGTPVPDPGNPRQRPGLFGGVASELWMPEYVVPDAVLRRPDVPQGTLTDDIIIDSAALDYEVAYRVYTPDGYTELGDLASIYVLDGEVMLSDDFGAAVTMLDNLIADGEMRPVIAIFIDARRPDMPQVNRRDTQFSSNPRYAQFVAEELVPAIDAAFATDAQPGSRAIVGGSLGGVAVLYFGATYPEVFGKIGAFSAPFSYTGSFRHIYAERETADVDVFVGSGNPRWDVGDLTPLVDLLATHGYPHRYLELGGQGHSYILYRDLLVRALPYFFPPELDGD